MCTGHNFAIRVRRNAALASPAFGICGTTNRRENCIVLIGEPSENVTLICPRLGLLKLGGGSLHA
jgi:hypothetical protein